MASNPSSSPTPESPSAQFQLTPRSKVKALLASLDNDSDDGSDDGSARARLLSVFKTTTTSKSNTFNDKDDQLEASEHGSPRKVEDHSQEEDDEDIVRPKGRMAARMLAAKDNAEGDRDETPQDRVKKILITKSKSPDPPTSTKDVEDSDENNDRVITRKRKTRVPRPSTPKLASRDRTASPGLFVSPSMHRSTTPLDDASDSDELPDNPAANDRFMALVEKKRQERLAKEKEVAAEKAKKMAEWKEQDRLLEDDEDISDDHVERRLTQQTKPTRKASKKALEEMRRETQRMSRNMQLAHNPTTKKKVTKAELFARFNYRPIGFTEEPTEPNLPSSSSSTPHSDIEMGETPPTSPASHKSDLEKPAPAADVTMASTVEEEDEDGDLPTLEDALNSLPSSPPRLVDKGKRKAVEQPLSETRVQKPLFKQRPVRVRLPKMADRKPSGTCDSDSDLEIVTTTTANAKTKKLDFIFDRIPEKQAKEPHSLQALRILAHLTSPRKQNIGEDKKPSLTISELQVSLQQRARQQAAREREERLQALRDKGVIIQTAEEREKELAEVEDLLAKARREGEEIMKREKAAAKKERKANGEVDPLGDSSDDEDWEEEKESLAEELSGSDDEEQEQTENDGSDASGEDEEEDAEAEAEDTEMALDSEELTQAALFDNEADETDDDEAAADLSIGEDMVEADTGDAEGEDEDEQRLPAHKQRRSRKTTIISDDEDVYGPSHETPSAPRTKSPKQLNTDSPGAPNSVLRSATKTFIPGLTVTGVAGLGLTQIFAGTMDESQMEASPDDLNSEPHNMDNEHDSLPFLRRLPVPELPNFVPTMEEDTQDVVMDSQSALSHVPESQVVESQTQGFNLQFSQSQIHGFDSIVPDPMATQFSEVLEATQDAGFRHMTPIRGRFAEAPPSTIDTVVLGPAHILEPMEDTPTVKKKGKLRRRAQIAAFSDDEDPQEQVGKEAEEEEDFNITANVFDVMRKASKRKEVVVDEFDKKKSKAKDMVHEQAEESEDEYAGLGGASDDESGEEDDFVKEMIDDTAGKDVDESKLAAFFAYVSSTNIAWKYTNTSL